MNIPELTAKIAALEISEAEVKAKLETASKDLIASQSLADEAQVKLTAEIAKTAELTGKLATAEIEIAIAKSAATLAAKDLALSREYASRFGATPPAKTDAGQEAVIPADQEKPKLTGMDKARAYLESKQPKAA
jgi:hypothetical protein